MTCDPAERQQVLWGRPQKSKCSAVGQGVRAENPWGCSIYDAPAGCSTARDFRGQGNLCHWVAGERQKGTEGRRNLQRDAQPEAGATPLLSQGEPSLQPPRPPGKGLPRIPPAGGLEHPLALLSLASVLDWGFPHPRGQPLGPVSCPGQLSTLWGPQCLLMRLPVPQTFRIPDGPGEQNTVGMDKNSKGLGHAKRI